MDSAIIPFMEDTTMSSVKSAAQQSFFILLILLAVSYARASFFDKQVTVRGQSMSLYDAMASSGVDKRALDQAIHYFEKNPRKFPNKRYLVLIDYSKPSSQPRFYLFNLTNGTYEKLLVAHGAGSGGREARLFSNRNESRMTSLGIYSTAETYYGKHGRSLKMDGHSITNSQARRRLIVIHGASVITIRKGGRSLRIPYVSQAMVNTTGQTGRSWGCPALDPEVAQRVINQIKDGALVYAFNKGLVAEKAKSTPARAKSTRAVNMPLPERKPVQISEEIETEIPQNVTPESPVAVEQKEEPKAPAKVSTKKSKSSKKKIAKKKSSKTYGPKLKWTKWSSAKTNRSHKRKTSYRYREVYETFNPFDNTTQP